MRGVTTGLKGVLGVGGGYEEQRNLMVMMWRRFEMAREAKMARTFKRRPPNSFGPTAAVVL